MPNISTENSWLLVTNISFACWPGASTEEAFWWLSSLVFYCVYIPFITQVNTLIWCVQLAIQYSYMDTGIKTIPIIKNNFNTFQVFLCPAAFKPALVCIIQTYCTTNFTNWNFTYIQFVDELEIHGDGYNYKGMPPTRNIHVFLYWFSVPTLTLSCNTV